MTDNQKPQERLAICPEVAGWLDTYYEAVSEDRCGRSDAELWRETVAAFEDNLQDMSKDDAVESMWCLVGDILSTYRKSGDSKGLRDE